MQNILEQILYIISKIFHLPVILVLLGLLVFICFQCGIFVADFYLRIRNKNAFTGKALQKMAECSDTDADEREIALAKIIHEAQDDNNRKIQSAKYCVKIGPIVGLIGTLSPMATALAGLSPSCLISV